jgi:hypothetical protein
MIVAVDFDGTVVEHRFPDVGPDVTDSVHALRYLVSQGHKIILWTMRSGVYLEAAVKWYADRGIPLYGINANPGQRTWTDSPKAYANVYVDDAAVGCPLIYPVEEGRKPFVDWGAVLDMIHLYDAGPQGGHKNTTAKAGE